MLILLTYSCNRDNEPIEETSSIITEGTNNNEENNDNVNEGQPEDKTETQRVVITAFVDDKFILPSGTRCEAEFYNADGIKLDCEKFLSAASEHSFYVGAELEKGKQYTCLVWIDNGQYGYDLTNGLKNISMTTKPRLAFYGKLDFNSETTQYELEMREVCYRRSWGNVVYSHQK